jgi:predicted NBD/HSP70 family sugar kinase
VIGAFDLGGTKIAAGLVVEDGRLLAHQEDPTDAQLGLADRLGRMAAMLRQALQQSAGLMQTYPLFQDEVEATLRAWMERRQNP